MLHYIMELMEYNNIDIKIVGDVHSAATKQNVHKIQLTQAKARLASL